MSKYAMVLNERVIDIVSAETEPHYPPDISGNEVAAVLCDDTVYIGMGYQDGVFSEVIPKPEIEPQKSSLSETEQAILQTAITTEYMAALMEING
jgi:hypothetical protein